MRRLFSSLDLRVFKLAKPPIMIMLINKIGAIGLALIPIVLVEKQIPTLEASMAMTVIKTTLIIGTLASGWLIDRFGARGMTLLGLLMSAFGLGFMPLANTAAVIAVLGIFAQFSEAITRIAIRVQLTTLVPYHDHKEAFAWIRTAANVGQIVSFSVGFFGGALGTTPLFLFDAVTSLLAYGYGYKILPRDKKQNIPTPETSGSAKIQEHINVFFIFVIIFSGYVFFYDLYSSAVAGRLELVHPGKGLRIFSFCMVVNCILCTILAIPAAKYLHRPSRVMPLSIIALFISIVIAIAFSDSLILVFLSTLIFSGAEAAMMTFSQFALIRLAPATKNNTTWYSTGQTLVQSSRIVAGAVAFPWFIQHQLKMVHFVVLSAICGALVLFAYSIRRALDRATA